MRPTRALIHISHLQNNYRSIRKSVSGAKVMAVVKADAYGHGVKRVVEALNELEQSPEYFAVAYSEEGVELRDIGVTKPVLFFDLLSEHNIDHVVNYNLIPTVSNEKQLSLLRERGAERKTLVHVNVDTGMGRVGVPYSEAADFLRYISTLNNVICDGIYTHFATSDESDKSYAVLQLNRFRKVLDELKGQGIEYGITHAANSGAIVDMPEAHFDMVRPGISLYGYFPSLETSESIELKPVLSLVSEVSSVRRFAAGESVSYGRRYVTNSDTTIVSVPLGYADGVSRGLTNRMKAIINNELFPQVGTVTMDRIMFDVGDAKVSTGDKVVLIGNSGNHQITAWNWSTILDTIPYEITCGISKRVPRCYIE